MADVLSVHKLITSSYALYFDNIKEKIILYVMGYAKTALANMKEW